MGALNDLFPFNVFKNLIPNNASALKANGLSEKFPRIIMDFTGNFNEARLLGTISNYMCGKGWAFGPLKNIVKGSEHNHELSGFRRLSEYFRAWSYIRVKVHGLKKSSDPDKPDHAYVRIWFDNGFNKKWSIDKDYQGWSQVDAKTWWLRTTFDKLFLKREYEEKYVHEVLTDYYGLAETVKKELGIDVIAYEGGLKRKRRNWH